MTDDCKPFSVETKEALALVLDMAYMVEARRPYAVGHSKRVSLMAVATAKQLKLPGKLRRDLRIAGLLHDLGYIVLPDDILATPNRLTKKQREVLDSHRPVCLQMLSHLEELAGVCNIIRYMHHRFDGKGADGKPSGEDLPVGSRLLAIAEVFDALCHNRPHRQGVKISQALGKMSLDRGRFDPDLLKSFVETLRLDVASETTSPEDDEAQAINPVLLVKRALDGEIPLPSLPRAVAVIEKAMREDDVSISRMAQAIEVDPAIAIRLIVIGNSAVFRGMNKIQSVSEALVRIGLSEACNLLASHMYAELFHVSSLVVGGIIESWWEHCLLCAMACQGLASFFELPGKENAYLLGLVHDVGKMALMKAVLEQSGGEDLSNLQLRVLLRVVDEQHRSAGVKVLADSKLSPEFIAAVSTPRHKVDMMSSGEAKVLSAAHALVGAMVSQAGGSVDALYDRMHHLGVEISPQGMQVVVQATLQKYRVTRGILAGIGGDEIPIDSCD